MLLPGAAKLLETAIRPALQHIGKWSPVSEMLDVATAAHESRGFQLRRQIGGGPALGLWQMEPATHNDVRLHWEQRHPDIMALVDELLPEDADLLYELETNDRYGAAMARLKYAIYPDPLPDDPWDVGGLAKIYKRIYNGLTGKATESEFIADFARYVGTNDGKVAA